MRILRLSFCAIACVLCVGAAAAQNWKNIYSGPGPAGSRVVLEQSSNLIGNDEPGSDYGRLIIRYGKDQKFILNNLNGIPFSERILFPSGSVALGKDLKLVPMNSKGDKALALADWGGGEDDKLILIGFDAQGMPSVVWREAVEFMSVKDYDNDGLYDILKQGGHGEPVSDHFSSYDPYLVYKQNVVRGKSAFTLDEDLSKKWSVENGYAWHGSHYNESLHVDVQGKVQH